MRTTLDQWKALQAVVDHGGYANAAEALHRSQSTISYAISKLEEQLGVDMLVVKGRKAVLTEIGESLLAYSRTMMESAENLEKHADNYRLGWEPEIGLVVDAACPTDYLMQVLAEFSKTCSQTRVRLKEVVISGGPEALEASEADVVVTPFLPSGYLAEELFDIEFLAVAHRDHPLSQLERDVTAGDLKKHTQVVVADSGRIHKKDIGWLGAENRWTVTTLEKAVATISNNLGFGWLPSQQIRKQLEQEILRPIHLVEGKNYHSTLFLVYGRKTTPGPGAQQLTALFKQYAKTYAMQSNA